MRYAWDAGLECVGLHWLISLETFHAADLPEAVLAETRAFS